MERHHRHADRELRAGWKRRPAEHRRPPLRPGWAPVPGEPQLHHGRARGPPLQRHDRRLHRRLREQWKRRARGAGRPRLRPRRRPLCEQPQHGQRPALRRDDWRLRRSLRLRRRTRRTLGPGVRPRRQPLRSRLGSGRGLALRRDQRRLHRRLRHGNEPEPDLPRVHGRRAAHLQHARRDERQRQPRQRRAGDVRRCHVGRRHDADRGCHEPRAPPCSSRGAATSTTSRPRPASPGRSTRALRTTTLDSRPSRRPVSRSSVS